MWNDPIVNDVRKSRDAHAKKFNYDLYAIANDLTKQQKASGKKFVKLPPRKPAILPNVKVGKER
jgi:hypothetical protein